MTKHTYFAKTTRLHIPSCFVVVCPFVWGQTQKDAACFASIIFRLTVEVRCYPNKPRLSAMLCTQWTSTKITNQVTACLSDTVAKPPRGSQSNFPNNNNNANKK